MTSITSSGEVYRERPKKEVAQPKIEQPPVEKSSVKMEQVPTSAIPHRAPLDSQEKLEDLKLETELGKQARSIAMRKQREKLAYKQDDDGSFVPVNPEEIKISVSEVNIMVSDPHELPEHIKRLVPVGVKKEPEIIKQKTENEKELEEKRRIILAIKAQLASPIDGSVDSEKYNCMISALAHPTTNNQSSEPQTTNHSPQTDDIYELEGDLESKTESGYALLEKLGTGGEGEVYRGKDLATGEEVAIKYGDDLDQEVLAKKLNHPNITRIKSSGEDKKGKFIAREYVKGKSLAEILKEGKLPYDKLIVIAKQILNGLNYLHSEGIVHGDLKPENILVPEDLKKDSVKITDFGLSREVQTDGLSHSVKTTTIKGTPRYMAPERIKKGEKATKQSDVYELGELLFEMLTGDVLLGPDDERLERYAKLIEEKVWRGNVNQAINDSELADMISDEIREAKIGSTLKYILKSNLNKRYSIDNFAHAFNYQARDYEEAKKRLSKSLTKKFDEFDEKEKQEALAKQPEQTHTASLDTIVEKEEKGWRRFLESGKTVLKCLTPGYSVYKVLTGVTTFGYNLAAFADMLTIILPSTIYVCNQENIRSPEQLITCVIAGSIVRIGFNLMGKIEETEDEELKQPPSPNYKPKEETSAKKLNLGEAIDELRNLVKNDGELPTPQPPQQYQTPQPRTNLSDYRPPPNSDKLADMKKKSYDLYGCEVAKPQTQSEPQPTTSLESKQAEAMNIIIDENDGFSKKNIFYEKKDPKKLLENKYFIEKFTENKIYFDRGDKY